MSNKQVIIDRVDVSGCEKQGETIAGITCGNGERIRLANEIITKHKLCKDNPNCVYKQLKRKEQACKEWKEEYHAKVEELNELEEKLLRKEQECKELEKELAKVYKDIKLSPLCYKCDEEECLQKEIDKLKAENEMLRDELRFYKDFYYAYN